MKSIVKKTIASLTALVLCGAFMHIPGTAQAFNPAKPRICFTKENTLKSIDLDWQDGSNRLHIFLMNQAPDKDADQQIWVVNQIVASELNQSIDSTKNRSDVLALNNNLQGTGQQASYGDDRFGSANEPGYLIYGKAGKPDFAVEVDLDGSSNDIPLFFRVDDKGGAGTIRHFVRTDSFTNDQIREKIRASATKYDAAGDHCFYSDSDRTEIQFKTKDEGLVIDAHDRYGNDKLLVKANRYKLFSNNCANNPTQECNVQCVDKTNKLHCVDSEKTCTDNIQGTDVVNCKTAFTPPKVCREGIKDQIAKKEAGCIDVPTGGGSATKATPTGTTGPNVTGTQKSLTQKTIDIANPLNYSTPQDLVVAIINWILGLTGFVALAMIIVGGYTYITSRGEEKNLEKAKNTLTYAIVGLIIVILSFIIVRTIRNVLYKDTAPTTPTGTTAPAGTTTGTGTITGSGTTGASSTTPQSNTNTTTSGVASLPSSTASTATTPGVPHENDVCHKECIKVAPTERSDLRYCSENKCTTLLGNKCVMDNFCVTKEFYCSNYCILNSDGENQCSTTSKEECSDIKNGCQWSSSTCVPK